MQPDADIAYHYRITVSDIGFPSDIGECNTTNQKQTEECVDLLQNQV